MNSSSGYQGGVVLWPPTAVWSRSWRGVAAAALHPFLIVVTSTIAWLGIGLSIGLLPLGLLGVPVFGLTALASRGLAAVERSRAFGTLGLVVDEPQWPEVTTHRWWWSGAFRSARMGATWRGLLYEGLTFPLVGTVLCVVALSAPGFGIGAIVGPWVFGRDGNGLTIGTWTPGPWAWTAAGIVSLLLTPVVVQATAAGWAALVRSHLGAGRAEALTKRVETLTVSRDAVAQAAQAERERIERDLHDGAQQRLVSLTMNLGIARSRMERDPEGAAQHVAAAHEDAKAALAELRDLARGIHPVILADRGLDAALSAIAARCPVPVTMDTAGLDGTRCSAQVEAVAYFVVAEALTNVAKHSGARSVLLEVRTVDDARGRRLCVRIEDDGRGGANVDGSGLRGLADRVAALDGSFTVVSPPGGRTVLAADLPCGNSSGNPGNKENS